MQGIDRARLYMEPAIRYYHVTAVQVDDLREVLDEEKGTGKPAREKYKYTLFFAPFTNIINLQKLPSASHPLTSSQPTNFSTLPIRQPANNTSQLQWASSRKRSWSAALLQSTNTSSTNINAKMLANSKFNTTTTTAGYRSMVPQA